MLHHITSHHIVFSELRVKTRPYNFRSTSRQSSFGQLSKELLRWLGWVEHCPRRVAMCQHTQYKVARRTKFIAYLERVVPSRPKRLFHRNQISTSTFLSGRGQNRIIAQTSRFETPGRCSPPFPPLRLHNNARRGFIYFASHVLPPVSSTPENRSSLRRV